MTITIEEIEFEAKVRSVKAEIAVHANNIRVSLSCLEEYMKNLHKLLPNEHIASFSVSVPAIPGESEQGVPK